MRLSGTAFRVGSGGRGVIRVRLAVSGAALAFLVSLALVPLSSVKVYADADPDNHGHHYGWNKQHHRPPPPPAPAPPPPRPTSPPTQAPALPPHSTHGQSGTSAGGAANGVGAQTTATAYFSGAG